jgi:hypothetical protein
MSQTLENSQGSSTQTPPAVRVFRWVFCKRSDIVICELTFADGGDIELGTFAPNPASSPRVERFRQVANALQRRGEIEAALITDGWTLAFHELVGV